MEVRPLKPPKVEVPVEEGKKPVKEEVGEKWEEIKMA